MLPWIEIISRRACEWRISINARDSASTATRKVDFVTRYNRWNTVVYDFTYVSGADVNAYYVGTRLLPITNGRLSPRLVHKRRSLGVGAHIRARLASTADGCIARPMRRSELAAIVCARVVSRRLPRHNYPSTVYLRPLFNLQLMFQIAINPSQ